MLDETLPEAEKDGERLKFLEHGKGFLYEQ